MHAIHARQDQKDSPNVVTSTLQVFILDIYVLSDPWTTFHFVTSYIAINLGVGPKNIFEPLSVSTPF